MDFLFITALSWIFLHTAVSAGSEPCCGKKKVGSVLYNLIKEEDTSAYGCQENCVYQKDGEDGQRFCFTAGYLESVCVSSYSTESTKSEETSESTEPPQSSKTTESTESTEAKETTNFALGILIAGGNVGQDFTTDVEMFLPSTKTSKNCTQMSITGGRQGATLNTIAKEPVICGGNPADPYDDQIASSCQVFRERQWYPYASLLSDRLAHTTWLSPDGLLLIGGYGNVRTTELVPSGGGQSVQSFDLKHDTGLVCSISFEDSIIITGGVWSIDAVTRYNLQGYVEDLPALNQGRYWHGCGSYKQPDGTVVLIVAGGGTPDGMGPPTVLDSTEKLVLADIGTPIWTETKPLPRGLYLMASVSTENRIFIFGGSTQNYTYRAEILEYVDGDDWKVVGNLQQKLASHAATVIDSDLIEFC